jgi:predicted nucleotidyltransferase
MPETVTLEQRHADIVRRILREHVPRNDVWAFGSRAGGSPKPHSDLDLVIVDPPMVSEAVFARLKLHFEESDLPIRVDVSILSALAVSFQVAVKQRHIAFMKPDESNLS